MKRNAMLALVLFVACKSKDEKRAMDLASLESATAAGSAAPAMATPKAEPAPAEPEAKEDRADESGDNKPSVGNVGTFGFGGKQAPGRGPAKGTGSAVETATRAWFPETFLFEPLVVTDDTGKAVVPVKVPDRLTTWRVLALGHSRTGAQAGATTSFLGTLPTYIEPVVPPFLIAGDQVRLPIQVVNTTLAPVSAALSIEAKGATVAGGGTRVIPAGDSVVEYATLRAPQAGTVQLLAALGGTDAVVRSFDVVPSGKPVRITRTGTLAAPRSLTMEAPADAERDTSRVRLLVYPGALALLRSELAASSLRGSVADDAYALLLAGRAPALLTALGDKADLEALRTLSIVAGQRAIRSARTLDVTSASLLAEAAIAHPQNPVLSRLGERAAAFLAQRQAADGTFLGETGWTLQRVLVQTADATRAVAAAKDTAQQRQRAMGVGVRAGGAFERNLVHVQDGYTAAAIVASGIGGKVADELRPKILEAIKTSPDGNKYLDVPAGVVRADGSIPGRAEATALAILALAGDPKAPLADLGSTLLGSYDPLIGWGDGRANLACIQAVIELFKAPLPSNVVVTLTMDGKEITRGTLEGTALKDVLILDALAPGIAGAHTWELKAEPAVPGLGFSLTAHAWTPWPKQTVKSGLELALPATMTASVGKPVDIAITAIAPAHMPLHIQHALPAGVQVDKPSLQALVDNGALQRFVVADGKVDLYVPALQPGQTFSEKYRVIPTLGGTLHTQASLIESGAHQFHVPPTTWTIR